MFLLPSYNLRFSCSRSCCRLTTTTRNSYPSFDSSTSMVSARLVVHCSCRSKRNRQKRQSFGCRMDFFCRHTYTCSLRDERLLCSYRASSSLWDDATTLTHCVRRCSFLFVAPNGTLNFFNGQPYSTVPLVGWRFGEAVWWCRSLEVYLEALVFGVHSFKRAPKEA